jgi:hypothetical protein
MVFESYDCHDIDGFENRLATAASASFMILYTDGAKKLAELTGSGE